MMPDETNAVCPQPWPHFFFLSKWGMLPKADMSAAQKVQQTPSN